MKSSCNDGGVLPAKVVAAARSIGIDPERLHGLDARAIDGLAGQPSDRIEEALRGIFAVPEPEEATTRKRIPRAYRHNRDERFRGLF